MILEESLKAAKDLAGAPPPSPDAEPTTRDVFRDSKNESRFGKMLERESARGNTEAREVAAVLAFPKSAKPGDLERADRMRQEFADRINGSAEILSEINKDTIADFAGAHPELERVMRAVGREAAVDMIHKWLPEIAVDDPDRFAEIRRNFKDVVDFRNDNEAKRQFESICNINRIPIDMHEFVRVMQHPDEKTRIRELRGLVRAQLTGFERAVSGIQGIFGGGMIKGIADDLEQRTKGRIEMGKVELARRKEILGRALGLMFDENDEVREALFLEMQGKRAEPHKIMDVREARTRSIDTEADAIKMWEAYKKKPEYAGLGTDAEKQTALDEWKERSLFRAEGEDKGGGIWGAIVRAFVEALLGRTNFAL